MVSVQLHVFAQIFTAFVSAANALYYFYIYKCTKRGHLMKWEVAWVACVETVNYIIQIATGSPRIELANGAMFPWMRYVGWQLTCPVLLAFIVINMLENSNTRIVIQLLMLLQFIILSGMTASLVADMGLKIIFVIIATLSLCIMYYKLYTNRKNKETPTAHNKEYHLLLYFMTSWLCFPILFILGPEMTDVIPFEYTLVGHCVGDLISKNAFGLLAWQYTRHVHKKKNKVPEIPTDQENPHTDQENPIKNAHTNKQTPNAQMQTITLPLHMFPYAITPKHSPANTDRTGPTPTGATPSEKSLG